MSKVGSRYRHRKTGLVVSLSVGETLYLGQGMIIPANIVEESSEWESLNPLFTSEDGVDVMPGSSWYYLTKEVDGNYSPPKRTNTMAYGGKPSSERPVVRFSTYEAAVEWRTNHNKSISFAEISEQATKFKISVASIKLIAKYLNIKY